MPIYNYKCQQCQHSQEHFHNMSAKISQCPICTSKDYERTLSAPNVKTSQQTQPSSNHQTNNQMASKYRNYGCAGSCKCH